jgi:carbonic anhydrase
MKVFLLALWVSCSWVHADEQSLLQLKNGNTRFVTEKCRLDGKSQADRAKLVEGQSPHAIVLSCADSRVPTEQVFDQVPGDIFTVRVAGQALDSSVLASIEYAVEHLGPQLIVVMGHTGCGALKAALTTPKGQSAGSPDLDKLISDIRPRLEKMSFKTEGHLKEPAIVNAKGVARDLVARSGIIAEKVKAGKLTIQSAVYHLDSGKVEFF